VKRHSLSLIEQSLYKESYNQKSIEFSFQPYKSFQFRLVPQNKDNYKHYPWKNAMNPLVHLKGNRLKLKIPFQPDIDLWQKDSDIVMGIDLGLTHWAVVSVWNFGDKHNPQEIGRYFIGDNELSNKKFSQGRLLYQDKVRKGVKKGSMKQKLYNLRLTEIKRLQRQINKRKKYLTAQGFRDFSKDYKYRQYKKSHSQCNSKVNRINRQIVQKLQHLIMEIAEYHHVGVIKVEDLRWVRPQPRKKTGAFLSFQQPHWLHSKIQKAIEFRCDLQHVKFRRINAKNTSKRCSKCGNIGQRPGKAKNSNIRTYKLFYCPHCDLTLDADLNAARNIAFATY
jgi:transposase